MSQEIAGRRTPFRAEKTNYVGYSKRLEDLCARLKAAGYRLESSRLDIYRETFATNELLIRENRDSELLSKIPFPRFLNDFHESNEILEACDEFPNLNTPGLRDRLERVLSGTRKLEEETPATGGPRNLLFELVMAATLKRTGFHVHLNRIEDVFFELAGTPCFVECKRVYSQRKLGERIGQAAGQIRTRCDDSRNSRATGIVAVDVSRLLNPGTHLFDCETRDALSVETEHLLEAYRALHISTLQSVQERCVLGVYVYARLPGAVRQPVGLWTARKAIFIILHPPSTKSGKLAFKFFNQIKSAMEQW
jgi:hypothetical protein